MRYNINSENTKRALSDSLKQLVKQNRTGDKITISSICGGCNANRNTFYYHFSDIHQLILWTLHNDFYQQFHTFDDAGGIRIREFAVSYLQDNGKFLNFAYQELGFDAFHRSCTDELYPIVLKHIEHLEKGKGIQPAPAFNQFLAEFYSEQVSSLYLMQFRRSDRYHSSAAMKCLEMIFDYAIPDMLSHKEALDFH